MFGSFLPSPAVVKQPQSTRVEEPTLLCNQVPKNSGGLDGSTQHSLEVNLQESQQLKSFASLDSIGTLPRLVLIE
jgi:hypothetical protein